MSDQNGSVPEELEAILAGVEALIGDLDKRIAAVHEQLEPLQSERRRLAAMLRAAYGPNAKPGAKPKKRGGHTTGRATDDTVELVVGAINKLETPAVEEIPGSFGARTLEDATGLNSSTIHRAINVLIDHERIRLVGQRKLTTYGRESRIYVLTDA